MKLKFLPISYINAIKNIDEDKLYHIRLRLNMPVVLEYDGKYAYLSNEGVTLFENKAIICKSFDIKEIIENITECSLYAFNDKIKNGYLDGPFGIRIGVAGDCVFEDGKVLTIKNINSLSIRIPHSIKGSASKIINYIYNEGLIFNTLIISPPGFGKTTLLKDIARYFNENSKFSILIIDERGEFDGVNGVNIDKLRYSDKLFSLVQGVRSLAPNLVITDELCSINDWQCAELASNSGVKIIASCHGRSEQDVRSKNFFTPNVFDRYIVLKGFGNPGEILSVFDVEFNKL